MWAYLFLTLPLKSPGRSVFFPCLPATHTLYSSWMILMSTAIYQSTPISSKPPLLYFQLTSYLCKPLWYSPHYLKLSSPILNTNTHLVLFSLEQKRGREGRRGKREEEKETGIFIEIDFFNEINILIKLDHPTITLICFLIYFLFSFPQQ